MDCCGWRYRKKWKAAKDMMMQDMDGDGLALFKDASDNSLERDPNEKLSGNPMFEIERAELDTKKKKLDADIDAALYSELEGKEVRLDSYLNDMLFVVMSPPKT